MPDQNKDVPSAEEAALKRMTPVISHEIRNPLAVISNSTYFIKAKLSSGGPLDPKIEKHFGIIESEIKRADTILGEILAFARMEELQLREYRLNGLVEEALRGLDIPASMHVDKNLASDDSLVRADSGLFCAALRHIMRNGIEAMAGQGRLEIKTGVEEEKAFVLIMDYGPGIAPDIADKIFVPFFTTKPRGVGIGLAFARKALGLHRGSVELVKATSGASFRILLPRR